MLLRNNTLRIVNSSRADEGSYVCRADNQFGSAEMTAVLWVKGKWCPGGTLFSARLAKVRHQETDPNVILPPPAPPPLPLARLPGNLSCLFTREAMLSRWRIILHKDTRITARIQVSHVHNPPHHPPEF